jgi:hypothetical protein
MQINLFKSCFLISSAFGLVKVLTRTMRQNKILPIALAILFSSAVCFGQETESAANSNLTGTSLPAGAQRVLRQYVPAQIDQALEIWVSASNGALRRSATEVLLWTGNDLKKTGATTIVNRLTDTLKAEGWRYEVGGTENGITLFSLLKDGANPRAIVGLYGEADGTFVYALTELRPGSESTNSTTTPAANSNTLSYNGSVGDYGFTTPAGWSRSDSAGKIVLSKDGDKKIEFLPLMDSSGDLERDAGRIIWQVFKGCDAWAANGFEPDWGTFEKGRTAQGLEYYRIYRYAKKASDENSGFAQSKFDAILLLIKLGGKVAVVAGSQPFQTDYSKGTTLTAIDFILYDLTLKNAPESYDLKNDFLGSWSAVGGSAAVSYTFNANGTFHKGGASEFRSPYDPGREKVEVSSYGMTQTYNLSGNILTQNYKQTGEVVKRRIRIYQTKYDKKAWEQRLGFLPVGSNDESARLVLARN